MIPFKFLSKNEKTNWGLSGLLEAAPNPVLLCRVLDMTRDYIESNNLFNESVIVNMLLATMTRLFRDKHNTYEQIFIWMKIDDVKDELISREISDYVRDLQANAFTTVDVEAEMCQIVAERNNWVE